MVLTQRSRSLFAGFIVGLAVAAAAMLTHFTLQLPTSDYRARLYLLLGAWPALTAFYLGGAVLVAAAGVALAGGRDRWAFLGAAAGGSVVVLALWLRMFSYAGWLHDEDVTVFGTGLRIAVALLIGIGAVLLARSSRLTGAWSGRGV